MSSAHRAGLAWMNRAIRSRHRASSSTSTVTPRPRRRSSSPEERPVLADDHPRDAVEENRAAAHRARRERRVDRALAVDAGRLAAGVLERVHLAVQDRAALLHAAVVAAAEDRARGARAPSRWGCRPRRSPARLPRSRPAGTRPSSGLDGVLPGVAGRGCGRRRPGRRESCASRRASTCRVKTYSVTTFAFPPWVSRDRPHRGMDARSCPPSQGHGPCSPARIDQSHGRPQPSR